MQRIEVKEHLLWSKRFGEKMFAVIFIGGNLFLRVAKIRTRKNFLPHGTQKTIQQLVKGLACVCQDIEHPGSLESTKEV